MQLTAADEAVRRGEWRTALDLLDALGDDGRTAEGLELRAMAAYGDGRFEEAVSAWEALYALHVADGDRPAAARAAAMIAMYLMMDTGLMAPVRGWMRRTERLLEGCDETPAHALLAMVRTYERFMSGDMAEADRQAAMAIDLGARCDVMPAVVIGRVASARVRILGGDVDGGLADLDDIAVLLMSGEVDPLTTGMMYCELICAVQGLALHDRAAEWTDVMQHWRHGNAFGGINGRCRVHRAEVLRLSGPCDAAEEEALAACEELRPWMRREFGWPLAELATIRLRKGDLEGAEEALTAVHAHAWCPQPTLALLRLAQGDADGAATSIAEAIAHPIEIPSKERPPFTDLRMAPLYEAQAEIAAARGDADTAAAAATALEEIAARYPSRSLSAAAALATARCQVMAGRAGPAVDLARAAVATWVDVGAPFETGVARTVLAAAHRSAGQLDAADAELRAALACFQEYGAVRRAADVAEHLQGGGRRPPVAAASSEVAVFRAIGGLRTVRFRGDEVVVRDLVGFRHIERLLAAPGREVHVLDLVAAERAAAPAGESAGESVEDVHRSDGGIPVLDEQALAAYRRRLAEVDEDIEEAARHHDTARLERAQFDREYLIAEISRAVGLGGRLRTTGGDTEKARSSVARSIRYALGLLAEQHPIIAAHLDRSVRTGTHCRYEPDSMHSIDWST